MKFTKSIRGTSVAIVASLAAIAGFIQPAATHSWVEHVMLISANGTMVGQPGFPSGAVARGAPGFNDDIMVNMLPPNGRGEGPVVLASDRMCKSFDQYTNPALPRLTASPGDFLALRYLENGHVSLPDGQPNKPLNRGTIFIYGTTQPRADDTIVAIHGVWNRDGTGGDGRGRLLATRNYDDGQCYEANGGSISAQRQGTFKKAAKDPMGINLWCQADLQLPDDLPIDGTLTFYWLWDWPTLDPAKVDMEQTRKGIFPSSLDGPNSASGVRTPQLYTSCGQVKLAARAVAKGGPVRQLLNGVIGEDVDAVALARPVIKFDEGQDLNFAAVARQLTTNFDVDPTPIGGNRGNGTTGGGNNNGGNNGGNRGSTTTTTAAAQPTNPSRGGNRGSTRGGDRIKTVTVTAQPATVTSIKTVTVERQRETAPAGGAAPIVSATSTASAAAPTKARSPVVSPFLKIRAEAAATATATGLRRRSSGAWGFGVF
jgi:hypothetical protein